MPIFAHTLKPRVPVVNGVFFGFAHNLKPTNRNSWCFFNDGGNGFPDSSVGKESTCNAGDPGSIPRLGRSPEEGKGYPLHYSGLENSMDYVVQGVERVRNN